MSTRKILWYAAAALSLGAIAVGMRLAPRLDLIASNPNPLVRHFAPAWRSLKKITDLPFLPLTLFAKTELPIYSITITRRGQVELLANLPDYPESYGSENFKNTVRAEFRTNGYMTADAKVRYRGNSAQHWNAQKKSWQINLPAEFPLGERADLRLTLPEDRQWAHEAVTAHRAAKFGVPYPEMSFVRLRVNNEDMGVYLVMEGWEESFLERNGKQLAPIFTNIETNVDIMRPERVEGWEDRFGGALTKEQAEVLGYLLRVTANADDAAFERYLPTILDMESFFNWAALTIVSGTIHQSNYSNQSLYLNRASGRIESIGFDILSGEIGAAVVVRYNRILNRVIAVAPWRNEIERRVRAYVYDDAMLADDLAFYDKTASLLKRELRTDTKKLPTTAGALLRINRDRAVLEHNTAALRGMFERDGTLTYERADETYPLAQDALGRNETERQYIASVGARDPVVFASGIHAVTRDLIVPQESRLIIEPGSQLYLDEGVSILSYGPVTAVGALDRPIVIAARDRDNPWGSLIVANANATSTFRHVVMRGGSGATINGIATTGMLAINNAPAAIEWSLFSNNEEDDAINVKYGFATIANSRFKDTFSDAIDFDFSGGLVVRNTFERVGGDAIDLSFSPAEIRENAIEGCGDKGVSVGERSSPKIVGNVIRACAIGIAVKDASRATIDENTIENSGVAVALYRKKPHFETGGTAVLRRNTFMNNNMDFEADGLSSYVQSPVH